MGCSWTQFHSQNTLALSSAGFWINDTEQDGQVYNYYSSESIKMYREEHCGDTTVNGEDTVPKSHVSGGGGCLITISCFPDVF
jgi:hypothetical protein